MTQAHLRAPRRMRRGCPCRRRASVCRATWREWCCRSAGREAPAFRPDRQSPRTRSTPNRRTCSRIEATWIASSMWRSSPSSSAAFLRLNSWSAHDPRYGVIGPLVDSPMLFVLPIYGDGPVRAGDKLGLEELDGLADCWHVRTRAALGAHTGHVREVASRVQLAVEPTHRKPILSGTRTDCVRKRLSQDGERFVVRVEKRDAELPRPLGDLPWRSVWQDAVNAECPHPVGGQPQLLIFASGPTDITVDTEFSSLRTDRMLRASRQALLQIVDFE